MVKKRQESRDSYSGAEEDVLDRDASLKTTQAFTFNIECPKIF